MYLLIDIGNARVKWAVASDDRRWHYQAAAHDQERLPAICRSAWSSLPPPARIVVASVAPVGLNAELVQFCRDAWSCEPCFIESESARLGVTNGYQDPRQLGCDRWAALVGAWSARRAACIVIDCGTAITVDTLDTAGVFRGGVILPGVELMRAALSEHTACIAMIMEAGLNTFSTDTSAAVQSGVVYAARGGVAHAVAQIEQQLGPLPRMMSGGGAAAVAPVLGGRMEWCPDLVLRGLSAIAGDEP